MRRSEQVWSGSDVPFFGPPLRRPPGDDAGTFLPFADRGSRAARRLSALLLGVGSLVAGVATAGLLFFMALVLEFGSPPDGTDIAVAAGLGSAIAVGGIVLAVVAFRNAGSPTGLAVTGDRLVIAYPSFARSLVVPRAAVRVVAIEDGSQPMRDRERFPIAGHLPEDVFVDALDIPSAGPLGDIETARRGRIDPTPGVIWERPETPAHGDYRHDDPAQPGWASGGSARRPRSRRGFLFTKHGHSLPFLRSDALDVPNIAVIFHQPIRIPRPAAWLELAPASSRAAFFRGGRVTRGLLLHVEDPIATRDALASWGVVRQITAEDVTEEGLLLAKPLVGWRATMYALLVVGPIALGATIRWLR